MIGLGAVAEAGVLQLHEIADAGVRADPRLAAQPREGSDMRAGFDLRIHDVGERGDLNTGRERGIPHDGAGADAAFFADGGVAENLRERLHDGIRADRGRRRRW